MRRTHRPLVVGLLALIPACSSSSTEPRSCGEGTKASGDSCVPTAGALPVVKSVSLTSLALDADGAGPLYVAYPSRATATLAVDGEAFSSMVVLGLESADGGTGCTIGKYDVEHQPSPGGGAATLELGGELFLQPDCAALAGQKDVRAWISFDPFGHVDVAGRAAPTTSSAGSSLVSYFRQTRLSLDGCKGADPGPHPATCQTALEVQASPGLDVVLDEVTLDSDVASVAVLDLHAPGPDPSMLGPEYAGVTLAAPPPTQGLADRLPSTPHFHVNARVLLDGATTDPGTNAIDPNQLSVKFSLRPDPAHAPAGVSPDAFEWVPLSIKQQTLGTGAMGQAVSTTLVEQQFLAGLSSTQHYQKESPVYVDGKALELVQSLEGKVERYELRTCVVPTFAEASPASDATANNCLVRPVAVVVDHRTTEGVSTTAGDASSAAILAWGLAYDFSSGSTHNLRVKSHLGTSDGCDPLHCYSFSNAFLSLDGKFIPKAFHDDGGALTVFSFFVDAGAYFDPGGSRWLRTSFVIANQERWLHDLNLDDGVTVNLPEFSFSHDVKLFTAKVCVPDTPVCVTFTGTITPTVAVDSSVTFKQNAPAPGCPGGVAAPNGHCFKASATPATYSQAVASCKAQGGYLAELASADENTAAVAALAKQSLPRGWVGANHLQASCPSGPQGAVCALINQNIAWVWPAAGAIGYQAWAPGQPASAPYSTAAVVGADGKWSSFTELAQLPYVCELVTSYDLIGVVTPNLSFPLTFDVTGGVDYIADAGGELVVDPLRLSFPLTADLNAYVESTSPLALHGKLDLDAKVKLSGLEGEFDLIGKFLGIGFKYKLVDWDGIDYGEYNLAHYTTSTMISF